MRTLNGRFSSMKSEEEAVNAIPAADDEITDHFENCRVQAGIAS